MAGVREAHMDGMWDFQSRPLVRGYFIVDGGDRNPTPPLCRIPASERITLFPLIIKARAEGGLSFLSINSSLSWQA